MSVTLSPLERLVADARALFQSGLAAVDAGEALRRHVRFGEGALHADGFHYPIGEGGRVVVLGGGKAAAAMAAAVSEILAGRIDRGLVAVKEGHGVPAGKIEVREAGHPVPDARGASAAAEVLEIAQGCGKKDLAIILLSGGASSLLPLPVPGITLKDKREVTDRLLRAGASISELNTVRKHLSRIKGGCLSRAAAPAQVLSLILSDVVGDPLDVIASGPTVPDPTTFEAALSILSRHDPDGTLPAGPREYLRAGARGKHPETPKPGDPDLAAGRNLIVGRNRDALDAVRIAAGERGYSARVVPEPFEGEARESVSRQAREILEAGASGGPPSCLISGGETTVTVRGNGKGGRNTESALAFALAVEGAGDIVGLFGGTDGTDGPTDAAGAIATGETAARARRMGLDPQAFLDENDSYGFFERAGGLLITGPTMTNVMDLRIILTGPGPVTPSREGGARTG